jgi:hypothetical protein
MKKFPQPTPVLVTKPTVEKITRDEEAFRVYITADVNVLGALTTIRGQFTFPIDELSQGASLARMMTFAMRKFVQSEQCRGLSDADIRSFILAGPVAVTALRSQVEPYFATVALGDRSA